MSITQLMQIFNVSHKTIHNWFVAWETDKLVGLYDRTGRGRKPTFTPEQQEQIKQWVNQSPKQLQRVLQNIEEEWKIKVSKDTVKRVLKSLAMSWHRVRRVVGGKPDQQEYEQKLAEWKSQQVEIFQLPTYSPQLNLIEILWRFMKYEWIELNAYDSWESLVSYVEKILIFRLC